ncbi:MAG TPA: carboxypeptidase M32 [Chloroflexota bacterium]|jgi:carboxypeptidase Taq|nr:carboxypeptidase M32 [Chloroflexota bacterium]
MTGWDDLLVHVHELADVGAAAALLDWDQQTMMRPKSAESRAFQQGTIQAIHHERLTAPALRAALERAEREGNGPPPFTEATATALLREVRREVERAVKLPTEYVKELAETTARAFESWQRARAESTFALYRDDLARVIDLKRREAQFVGYAESPYDALLDEYEPGQTEAMTAAVFADMRRDTVQLLADLRSSSVQPDASLLVRQYEKQKQWDFGVQVLGAMGFDFDAGRQDYSAHPFTTSFSPTDVRVTTRVYEDDLRSGLFGTIHEGGHALYELGIDPKLARTSLASSPSLGMHESQSRLWENAIGRSAPFWRYWYPRLSDVFPEQLRDVAENAFLRAVNSVQPSFIRVEADEVTYNLHIILRFELETAVLSGRMEVDDLPEAWNAKMAESLGITPRNAAEGVLQDVHWSTGSLGYFPTYSLGNLYFAQILATLRRQFPDIDERIGSGDLLFVREWLREHIHRFGNIYPAQELIQRVTGEPLNPQYFTKYLRDKYGALYGLPARSEV